MQPFDNSGDYVLQIIISSHELLEKKNNSKTFNTNTLWKHCFLEKKKVKFKEKNLINFH